MSPIKQAILDIILASIKSTGKSPSQREIATLVKRRVSTVNQHISELVEDGYLARLEHKGNRNGGRNIVLPPAGYKSRRIDLKKEGKNA